jgi:NAD(P)-dependent dehydrogenase (short-subunit alcohol dehydrogenase family)
MKIEQAVVLVTGTSRGMGREHVRQLAAAGARKIYATARDAAKIADLVNIDRRRIESISLDITRGDQVELVARRCRDVTLLINNAGVNRNRPVSDVNAMANARAEIETNYYGLLRMCLAFAPILRANGGGMIVNVLSLIARVNLPALGTYSCSKAAAWSATQAFRAELAGQGTRVVGVYPGAVETDMTPGNAGAKPADIVAEIIEGIRADTPEIFPGRMAREMGPALDTDYRSIEKQLSQFLPK